MENLGINLYFGPDCHIRQHRNRIYKILSKIGYDPKPKIFEFLSSQNTFAFAYPLKEKPIILQNFIPNEILGLPEKNKRVAINALNNFFLTPNSQLLPLDIQYINCSFTGANKVLKSTDELLEITYNQPEFFFMNIAFLEESHNAGLIVIPDELIKIARENNLHQFQYKSLSEQDIANQQKIFNEYIIKISK